MSQKMVSKKQIIDSSNTEPDCYLAIKNDLFDEVLKIDDGYMKDQLSHYNDFRSKFQHNSLHPYSSFSWWYKGLKWMRFHVTATVSLFAVIILAGIVVTAQTAAPENFKPSYTFQPTISQSSSPEQKIGIILNNFTQCEAVGGSLDIQKNRLICIFQGNLFEGPATNKPSKNESENIEFNISQDTSSVDELER